MKLKSGKSLGFELGEWLDEEQMVMSKREESVKQSLVAAAAVSPCADDQPRNFEFVLLRLRREVSFEQADAPGFGDEFRALVKEVDQRWPQEPGWRFIAGYLLDNFFAYRTLWKYLLDAHFFPRTSFSKLRETIDKAAMDPEMQELAERAHNEVIKMFTGVPVNSNAMLPPWIGFVDGRSAYTSESMIRALRDRASEKIDHYGRTADEVMLVVYYDQALLYNSPYDDGIRFKKFADVAGEAARIVRTTLANRVSPFQKVFLLKALWPQPEVFEIWPVFSLCK